MASVAWTALCHAIQGQGAPESCRSFKQDYAPFLKTSLLKFIENTADGKSFRNPTARSRKLRMKDTVRQESGGMVIQNTLHDAKPLRKANGSSWPDTTGSPKIREARSRMQSGGRSWYWSAPARLVTAVL
ncbi:hypothetical protein EVAR_14730_1 [Eumeta japonica]|uniref:Uncharacterized protein n=1 Tax=Eumeta variegata TaxID=151549 RepID=A0A4C1TWN6_EUMVA|nr:hypothetical protein EVAR_14730_1 [Eumeta japonica]